MAFAFVRKEAKPQNADDRDWKIGDHVAEVRNAQPDLLVRKIGARRTVRALARQ